MAMKPNNDDGHPELSFPERIPTIVRKTSKEKRLPGNPVWTERKANIIKLYIDLFVIVVGRGIYIDAFAGHQYESHDSYWAAKLVWLANPGRTLRRIVRFELFEKNKSSFQNLKKMLNSTPADGRLAHCICGDSNKEIPEMLALRPIDRPAFCLLDQRTTECSWKLVTDIANHKTKGGTKIEIFYFLMASWKNRSLKNRSEERDEELREWWGRDDYEELIEATPQVLQERFVERFQTELGYEFVRAYPIAGSDTPNGPGKIHYYMIHASDHPEAPKFMYRAYCRAAGGYDPTVNQAHLQWDEENLNRVRSLYRRKGKVIQRRKID